MFTGIGGELLVAIGMTSFRLPIIHRRWLTTFIWVVMVSLFLAAGEKCLAEHGRRGRKEKKIETKMIAF